MQKPLYPEGPAVCHAILVHPPAGICGGDSLDIRLEAASRAHALVTTPGAGKWYRSSGAKATQRVAIDVAGRAIVEWLPQETIVYDGAQAAMSLDVSLSRDAVFVGMEILCLGRTASGETFERGVLALSTRIARAGTLAWIERGSIRGGSRLLDSAIGLDRQPVCGALLVAAPSVDADLLARARAVRPEVGRAAVTSFPGLLVARWLGPACEPARSWLASIWSVARPVVAAREAMIPRIWNT